MLLLLHVTYSCIFHAYIPSFIFILTLICVGAFCMSLSPSLFLLVNCSMAPKRKSIPSQNPLHSGASFSSSPANSNPSHVRFRDDKACKDFSENFSQRGFHSECQVVLSDFSDTNLPTIIYCRGRESLCGISVTCPSVII